MSFLLSLQLLTVLSARGSKTEGDGATCNSHASVAGTVDPDSDGNPDSMSVEAVGFVTRLVSWLAVSGTYY